MRWRRVRAFACVAVIYSIGARLHHQPVHPFCPVWDIEPVPSVRKREMEKETEMKQSKFKRICVFCGSSPGNKTTYKDAAIELGRELVNAPSHFPVSSLSFFYQFSSNISYSSHIFWFLLISCFNILFPYFIFSWLSITSTSLFCLICLIFLSIFQFF